MRVEKYVCDGCRREASAHQLPARWLELDGTAHLCPECADSTMVMDRVLDSGMRISRSDFLERLLSEPSAMAEFWRG